MNNLFCKYLFLSAIILAILIPLFTTCIKPEREVQIITLDTTGTHISYTSAILKGEITDEGSKRIEDHGIILSENAALLNPTPKGLGPANKGKFEIQFTDLKKNTLYYFRAYVSVGSRTILADNLVQFKTKDTQIPTVRVGTISETNMTSATLDGEVTSAGGEPSLIRGLCWGLIANPSITSCLDTTINGSGIGKFTGTMTGLTPGTQYYVRTYASNAKGVVYDSVDIIFKTHNLPSVSTAIVSGISNTGAISGGNVTDDGGADITARGVCWGTTTLPSIALTTKTSDGTGSGAFTSTLSVLIPLTTYYLRAYATNLYGTSYGNEITLTATKAPIVLTNPASSVLNTSVVLNGTVNANSFSSKVTFEFGLTTSYGSVIDATPGIVTGTIATTVLANISTMVPGSTYHFRVKAVNSGGTTYGDDLSFTTLQPPASITNSASNITSASATLNGTINANNYSTDVTFEYGITTSYGSFATAVESLVTGNTPLAVTAIITGLTPSTTYHFRVKAVSSAGTSTGDDSFLTTTAFTVTDFDGNIYNTVQIGTQTWMQENLKAKHFSNGDLIPTPFSTTTSSICWYFNNEIAYKDIYGGLYNTLAVSDVKNICPTGWHTASDEEWTDLINFLGGPLVAGGELKEAGFTHWVSSNTGATNSSGFTMLPGGYMDGAFHAIGQIATFVASQWHSGLGFYCRDIYGTDIVANRWAAIYASRSVRCIKGELALTETTAAILITSSTTTLVGKVNPNGASTYVNFEYGTTLSYGITTIASSVSGSISTGETADLTGLLPGTTYHFRIKAVNSGGTSYGPDLTFTTLP
jgi:uncharacterized protein (TIGR02145 family)